jgi:hypothetical protein
VTISCENRGGDFAFQPAVIALWPKRVLTFQSDHGDVAFGLPQNSFAIIRMCENLICSRPS